MASYQKEHGLISKLAGDILTTADFYFSKVNPTMEKSHPSDIFTAGDTQLDALIVKQISQAFPQDIIVSEESSGHLFSKLLAGQRGWIIDPLCGSLNFARHIKQFATNIILVEKKKTSAAWVVDHPNRSLIWSVGNRAVFVNKQKVAPRLHKTWLFNLDVGYWWQVPSDAKKQYIALIAKLLERKHIMIVNSMTSLSFAYVATGQFQAALTPKVKPWDLLAACFLVEQSGGKVTHFDGSSWGIASTQGILAQNSKIYNFIFRLLKDIGSGLPQISRQL